LNLLIPLHFLPKPFDSSFCEPRHIACTSTGVDESEKNSAAAPRRSSMTIAVGLVLVIALGAVGVLAWKRAARQATNELTTSGGVEATLSLDTFVVNLGGEGRAYLRIGIALGLSHPVEKNANGSPVPLVRDTILSVLTSAKPDQLLGAEGKQQLKTQILEALQTRAPQLGVEDVYFTEFLVQM